MSFKQILGSHRETSQRHSALQYCQAIACVHQASYPEWGGGRLPTRSTQAPLARHRSPHLASSIEVSVNRPGFLGHVPGLICPQKRLVSQTESSVGAADEQSWLIVDATGCSWSFLLLISRFQTGLLFSLESPSTAAALASACQSGPGNAPDRAVLDAPDRR